MATIPEGPLGLPDRIRAYRRLRGWSAPELARRLHVSSPSLVAHWESGRNCPTMWMLVELAHVFRISLDDLLDVHFGEQHDHH